jgi:addiction module HigA family antidote
MSTKKKGTLTTSGEWAKHLRKFKKRKFWKGERKEAKKVKLAFQKDLPHPGKILEEFYMLPLQIDLKQLSKELSIPENDVSMLLEGNLELTTTTAVGLSKLFNTTLEYWLNLQKSKNQSKRD